METNEINNGHQPSATSTVRVPEPLQDISNITPVNRKLNVNPTEDYNESPYGQGQGTVLTTATSRELRASEDEYLDIDQATEKFDQLKGEVEWFKNQFPGECALSDQVSFHFARIHDEISGFSAKISCLPDPVRRYKGILIKTKRLKKDLEAAKEKVRASCPPPLPTPRRQNRLKSLRSAASQNTSSVGDSAQADPQAPDDDQFLTGDTTLFQDAELTFRPGDILGAVDAEQMSQGIGDEMPMLQDFHHLIQRENETTVPEIETQTTEETVYVVGTCPRQQEIDELLTAHSQLSAFTSKLGMDLKHLDLTMNQQKRDSDSSINNLREEVRALSQTVTSLTNENLSLKNTFNAKYESIMSKVALANKETQRVASKHEELAVLLDCNKLTAESAEERSISLGTLVKDQKSKIREVIVRLDQIQKETNPQHTSRTNVGHQSNITGNTMNSTITTAPALESTVRSLIGKINRGLAEDLDDDLTDAQLKLLMEKNRPTAEEDIFRVWSSMEKYSILSVQDDEFINNVEAEIERAENYIRKLERVYRERRPHSVSTLKEYSVELPKFNKKGEMDILEFMSKFERKLQGLATGRQKAEILWSKFLPPDIQNSTIDICEDYEKLKNYLLRTHGNIHTVCDMILRKAEATQIPEMHDASARQEHMTLLNVALKKLERLSTDSNVSKDLWENTVLSPYFFKRLTNMLPREIYERFTDRLGYAGITDTPYQGLRPFTELKNFCQIQLNTTTSLSDRPVEKGNQRKQANVQIAQAIVNNPTHHEMRENVPPSAHPSRSSFASCTKNWWNRKYKQPCPMKDHYHELGTCKPFFQLLNGKRRNVSMQLTCWTCLHPKEECMKRMEGTATPFKCSREADIDKDLLCQDCAEYVQSRNAEFSPVCLFYCIGKGHRRPPFNTMIEKLKTLVPSFIKEAAPNPPPTSPTVNAVRIQGIPDKQTEDDPADIISFNSRTGEKLDTRKLKVKKESNDPVSYMLQWIKMGDTPVLAFFDSGANISIIQGRLAEDEGLKCLDKAPSKFGVCGGNMVETMFGRYKFNIGPDTIGEFRPMEVQGLDSVTTYFPRFNLDGVQEELTKINPNLPPLPDYIGGGEVKLLIGIKDPTLQPKLVETLPSGVCVYESQLEDIWGSKMCVAGQHPSFNRDITTNVQFIRAVFHMARVEKISPADEELFGSRCMKELQPIITDDWEEKIQTEATPISIESLSYIWGTRPCSHHIFHKSVHKTSVPLVRLTDQIAADEGKMLPNYRCDECAKCEDCRMSPKLRATTAQEQIEQKAIAKSVELDYVNHVPTITLPFLRDPVTFLKQMFRGRDNYQVALKVYIQQCRKPEIVKVSMRLAHQDLLDKGYMIELTATSEEIQILVKTYPINHFFPWRGVYKDDSLSTPVRLVVDPSMTKLNMILAKGENTLGKLNEILIRSRLNRFAFSTDISKMYNNLVLHKSAYPFSLFLFHKSLDEQIKPTIYLMLRGWYGVRSMGNQAGHSVDTTVTDHKEQFPLAVKPLQKDKYVDDVMSGAAKKKQREEIITQCDQVLAKAGFKLKYVVRSGEPPPEKASTDGKTVRVLGYVWNTEDDFFAPGMGEMNFHKKIRGTKKPNETPVVTSDDVKELLETLVLSKRSVASKLAEIYDPIGLWEPIKLALKLEFTSLNPIHWDDKLNTKEREEWSEIFQKIIDIPDLKVDRCVIPEDAKSLKMRMMCFSDAAAKAGGAAIYASYELNDGSFSSQLLTAKSRLMDSTIPRNELGGILLMAELAHITYRAIDEHVDQVYCFTDSTIAMSWVHNQNKRLKTYVLNRVQTIRRLLRWMDIEDETLPLFHIPGTENIADLLTKPIEISMDVVDRDSKWQSGPDWLKKPLEQMPITTWSKLAVDKGTAKQVASECIETPFCIVYDEQEPDEMMETINIINTLPMREDGPDEELEGYTPGVAMASSAKMDEEPFILNVVKVGWRKSIRILSIALKFTQMLRHNLHKEKDVETCLYCHNDDITTEVMKLCEKKVEERLFKIETELIKKSLPKSKVEKFRETDNTLRYVGRLEENQALESRDLEIFFDSHEFLDSTPVVRQDSPLFFAYAVFVHFNLSSHAGVETARREVIKKMHVIGGERKLVKKIRNDCPRCRIIAKRTVELMMAKHSFARTMIAPPFYNTMMDVMMGFKASAYLKSRKTFSINALVFVCVLTSATNILVLESLETQSVALAIERHSARYGAPANLFVDSGTQLVTLDSLEFSIRDLDTSVQNSMGINIVVSNPKSHEERGRVERKIRSIRDVLERTASTSTEILTAIGWETRFATAANMLDDIPLARAESTNTNDYPYEILTPNRLKLGRNNKRSPHLSMTLNNPVLPSDVLDRNRKLTETFYQIMIDRVHELVGRPDKWGMSQPIPPKVDDIVLFVALDTNVGKEWKLGRVSKVHDRSAEIVHMLKSSESGIPKLGKVTRSFRQISIIVGSEDIDLNTEEYRARCTRV